MDTHNLPCGCPDFFVRIFLLEFQMIIGTLPNSIQPIYLPGREVVRKFINGCPAG
jgi:hypothetical protein